MRPGFLVALVTKAIDLDTAILYHMIGRNREQMGRKWEQWRALARNCGERSRNATKCGESDHAFRENGRLSPILEYGLPA
jgi:hypothetical protein